jgi:NAD(P)H-nitrite reductase large subunit
LNVVIVGNSAAGIAAAETLSRIEPQARITVLSEEAHPPYSRCLITEVVAGAAGIDSIRYRSDRFYEDRGISLVRGARVHSIDPAARGVRFGEKGEITYDKLLLATGSRPVGIEVEGAGLEGVFALRSYDQAEAIARYAMGGKRAVIIGGGLVGLKAAYARRRRGLPVTVAVKSGHLLTRQLDAESASMVEKELREAGIDFIFGQSPVGFNRGPGGKEIDSVTLEDGREIPAGLALVAKGVVANCELVRKAGGETAAGVKVDRFLQTSLSDVYAAGDCIEVKDCVTGRDTPSALWTLAVEQGRFAAYNLAGRQRPYPLPLTRMNSAQFGGLPFISVGAVDEGEEVLTRKERGAYRLLAVREDRLIGAILVGLIEAAGIYTNLIKNGRPLGGMRGDLLEGRISAASFV